MKNKQVLLEKNADAKMYPASTTKIMTAMLAIKNGNLDDPVTVSHAACLVEGSNIGLREGEKMPLRDLIYALLLPSANDAAMAVAEHIGGSVEDFVAMMNDEAQRLGATGTHFTNPHGLPDANHYTTARDLARIAMWATTDPTFRKIVSTYRYHAERQLPEPADITPPEDFENTNRLLWIATPYFYQGTTGIKTGYTSQAGRCLVFSVKRDGRELLGVLLKSPGYEVYDDARVLADYGFSNFRQVELIKAGEEVTRAGIKGGVKKDVGLVASGTCYYNFPVNENVQFDREIKLSGEIKAPVQKGAKLGEIILRVDGQPVGMVDLLAVECVDKKALYWPWVLFTVLLSLVVTKIIKDKTPKAAG
jgi:D-alanyl-D-alanine carboxypeptidase (penicillin-binding protein 5/6)